MELDVYFDGAKNLNFFISELTSYDCSILSMEYIDFTGPKLEKDIGNTKKVIGANLHILLPRTNAHGEILNLIKDSKGMISMEEY